MGFLKNLQERLNPTPVALDELRPDLQECVGRLHPKDQEKFLSWCGGYGAPLEGVRDSEAYCAVLPTVGSADERYAGPQGRGILVLTSDRIMFMGDLDRLEIPMHQLSMSGWGFEERHGNAQFYVAAAPAYDPAFAFGFSTSERGSREYFVKTFETVVRESERATGGGGGSSAADELTKFARLRDEGVISNDEFEGKKSQLLGLGGGAQPTVVTFAVYEVVLRSGGPKKIQTIKAVRETLGLGLKEAKNLVDSTKSAPVVVKSFNTRYDADRLERRLAQAGATVTIETK